VIAVATAEHDATELRDDTEGVFENLWARVVAVHQDGDTS
jgi:hypothetical protein